MNRQTAQGLTVSNPVCVRHHRYEMGGKPGFVSGDAGDYMDIPVATGHEDATSGYMDIPVGESDEVATTGYMDIELDDDDM